MQVYEFHHETPALQRKSRHDAASETHERASSHHKASTSASIVGSAAGMAECLITPGIKITLLETWDMSLPLQTVLSMIMLHLCW